MHVRVCRDCGEEYRPGVLRCADCGGELEDRFGDEAPAASGPTAEEAAAAELAGQRVLFLTPRAADLVPLAERLREAGVEYRLSEQRGIGEGAPSRFALLVKDESVATALRALGDILAPHEEAEDLHAVETRFDAERGYLECPACGARTAPGTTECAECGLSLAGTGGEVEEPRE
jgi:hypothetical protein